jgi:hypothetical protein
LKAYVNAVAERVIGTLRRECLDHLIVLDEQHLSSVLREFVAYYNQKRPHRTLGLQTPEPRLRLATGPIRFAPRAEWAAPRLRKGCLRTSEVLPPHSLRIENAVAVPGTWRAFLFGSRPVVIALVPKGHTLGEGTHSSSETASTSGAPSANANLRLGLAGRQ